LKEIPLKDFIYLGTSLRYLQDARLGQNVHGWGRILYNLESFSRDIQSLNLRVTRSVFEQKFLDVLLVELRKTEEKAELTQEQALNLASGMSVVREALLAEAQNLTAYLLMEKRFQVTQLVNKPDTFLRQHTFAKLPPIAQSDIKEGCKCLAFDTPTAAGFLLLRATESALRTYYGKYFRVKKDEKLMWGPMITRLRSKSKKPRPNKVLLDHLDNIRFNFRNPTDHPEMTYGIEEAQDLFSLTTDVLNRIAAELP
jgi:hypothetical protein